MTPEKLTLVLEALERLHYEMFTHQGEKAIATIKEALAQPEQEPDGHFLDFAYADSTAQVYVYGQFQKGQQFYTTPPQQETQAYHEATQLAKWLFKTHYAQEEHYASGRVVWGLSDTTAGVISQIDNMVCKLVLPKEPEQKPDCVGTGVCVQTGLVCLGQTPQQQQPASPQVDVLVVNLIRAGVNKHLARELAEHSFKHTTPLPPEPVAWMDVDGNISDNNDYNCFPIPLYTKTNDPS